VSIVTDERNTGREIDSIFPYNFYQGVFYVRQDLIDNVPDVVQAICDAFMEATLWIRLYPEKAAAFLVEEPTLKAYGLPLLLQQTKLYNNLYKPTASYPFSAFYGRENARIAAWLKARNRITRALTPEDYEAAFDASFMKKTYEKLGWKVPRKPPFLTVGWIGKPGVLPYPPYKNALTMQEPQEWPEPSDLVRAWVFDGKTYKTEERE
jgi:sulfonate transport system substrate-binding protein